MTFNMRFLVLVLFIFNTLHLSGQNMPIEINTNWENVKTQFQSRAKAIGELVRISRAKIDKKQIDILKSAAFELSNHIDTLRLVDSISISLANEKNIKLMYAMKEVLISIDGQPVLKDTQTFFKIQMRLEGC